MTFFKKQNTLKEWLREAGWFLLDILYNAVVIVVLVVLIRSFLISPFRVIGSSMADTLESNEFILIDKLSYELGSPQRGDPIVFLPPITDKYGPKLEETLKIEEGKATLELDSLRTPKEVIYCQHPWVKERWFCQEPLKPGDFLFSLPVAGPEIKPEESAWKTALLHRLTAEEIEAEALTLREGKSPYLSIRLFDSAGPEHFVKRILGVPGDTIKIENGRVYLKPANNDSFRVLEETYLNEENKNHTYFNQDLGQNTFEVPEGHYFVLGDNRNHSNDSRSWFSPITEDFSPYVPLQNVSGKVLLVLWPPDAIRLISGVTP